ncbi:hypothetical protein LPIBR_40057 [Lacticaseibacillus paracasei]|nr:hypothetical protein LPIBR_40057 [Lacticaseibacillus paracasei]
MPNENVCMVQLYRDEAADASFKKPKLAICFTSLGSRVVSCDTLKNHAG